jgi:hypothetical protein
VLSEKGSWINRLAQKPANKQSFLGMDMNLDRNLQVPAGKANEMISQIERDVAFLKSLNIMDYSMLIGISEKSRLEGNVEKGIWHV